MFVVCCLDGGVCCGCVRLRVLVAYVWLLLRDGCCLLFVVCGMLSLHSQCASCVVCCSSFVVCCLVCVVCCGSLCVAVCCCFAWCVVCRVLVVACCVLNVACCVVVCWSVLFAV